MADRIHRAFLAYPTEYSGRELFEECMPKTGSQALKPRGPARSPA
jgi:hypothetical protein